MRAAIAALAFVTACAGNPKREVGAELSRESFMCAVPRDWSVRDERQTVILTSPSNRKHTIAIRAVALTGRRSASSVLRDTRFVVEHLPAVLVEDRGLHRGTPGTAEYMLTFAPGEQGERYRRTHVVVLGREHVFHVFETAPDSNTELGDAFAQLVDTLQEV